MHELAIAKSIVDAVCEHAGSRRVHTVHVVIGALCAVIPDSVQFCFDVVTAGTVAEGARLDIETPFGTGHCLCCGTDLPLDGPILLCACGSTDVQVTAGRELQITSMEVS